jgi:hypothetical protein
VTVAQLLPQTVVVGNEAAALCGRERIKWNPVRGHA